MPAIPFAAQTAYLTGYVESNEILSSEGIALAPYPLGADLEVNGALSIDTVTAVMQACESDWAMRAAPQVRPSAARRVANGRRALRRLDEQPSTALWG